MCGYQYIPKVRRYKDLQSRSRTYILRNITSTNPATSRLRFIRLKIRFFLVLNLKVLKESRKRLSHIERQEWDNLPLIFPFCYTLLTNFLSAHKSSSVFQLQATKLYLSVTGYCSTKTFFLFFIVQLFPTFHNLLYW